MIYFNQCMHCRNARKKRDIDTKKWYVLCENGVWHASAGDWNDGSRVECPDDGCKTQCPMFTERLVISLSEEA